MNLKDIVSVSGMPGLYNVVSQRPNGLVVSPLGIDKPKFASNRIHMFTPLEGITIYTVTDSVELAVVFNNIKANKVATIGPKESNQAHKDFMKAALPDYDEDRVYVSDIKKLIKWYLQLDENGLLEAAEVAEEKTEEPTEAAAEKKEPKAKKPKAKKESKD